MKRQKKIRNVSYKDVIDLDITIAKFILPRLKFFKKKVLGYPLELTFEEWKAIIDKMILSFSLILDDSEAYKKCNKEEEDKIEEGLQLFTKYFQDLWL